MEGTYTILSNEHTFMSFKYSDTGHNTIPQTINPSVRSDVLTAMMLKIQIFWDVTLSLVNSSQQFK
jgi:hypothetical protein